MPDIGGLEGGGQRFRAQSHALGHDDHAEARTGEQGQDKLGAIGQQRAEVVARTHPGNRQAIRQRIHLLQQVAIDVAGVAHHERQLVGAVFGGMPEVPIEGCRVR